MFRQLGIAIGCGLFFSSLASAATVEEVQKVLEDARAKVKSYTAKTKMTQDIDMGGGNKMQSTMEGTIEWMRKGDKVLYRNDNKANTVTSMGGQETKTESTAAIISDGDFMYTLGEEGGEKHAIKSPAEPSIAGDAKTMFEAMQKDSNIKVLPDEKVDGADCYVIEATPKDKTAAPMSKTVVYLRKDNALNVKNEGFDAAGKKIFSSQTTDIKLNAVIPADHFVFKAPAGVELMDLTKQPGK